jgi:peptidoglycan/xylan/chitin deacetylase (PgdA/CDA1 family)
MTVTLGNILGTARKTALFPLKHLLNLADPPVIVLIYHRVATLASDPEMLAVTPDNFRAQMRYLKSTVPVVRFEDDWRKISRPAVAITFDDGYADNALEALPIIEEVEVPATFFVSTGTIGTTREFWWHELEHLILDKRHMPANFTLTDARYGKSWATGTDAERQEFYFELVRVMTDAATELREEWLSQVRLWAGCSNMAADTHRAMTKNELRLLAASRWVTIGAHTVTHSRLSSLPTNVQHEEIVSSKRQLETWLGQEITTFSYPFGRRCDYTQETSALCREAGFMKAASNFPGQAHRWTDAYQIPRHLIRNWPMETFAEKLRGFWTR